MGNLVIGYDRTEGPIGFREADHTYTHLPTGRSLTSVSSVIRRVYAYKDWSVIDPDVLENARVRGMLVDQLLAQYVSTGSLDTVAPAQVAERLRAAHQVWESMFSGLFVEPQKILFSLEDGVAGTVDFSIEDDIIADLKCTWSVEPSWILQLGAYAELSGARRAGIIHVNKSGGRWLEYDTTACRLYWRRALSWWRDSLEMEKLKR